MLSRVYDISCDRIFFVVNLLLFSDCWVEVLCQRFFLWAQSNDLDVDEAELTDKHELDGIESYLGIWYPHHHVRWMQINVQVKIPTTVAI
jgi:hypothetical protein